MNGKTIAFNLRNGVEYDENGITTATKAFINSLADIIEELEKAIEIKQMRIENMEMIIEHQQKSMDIMAADIPEWHFVNFRPLTDEEKAHYKDEYDETPGTMIENLPDDGEEVILWDVIYVQPDTYFEDDVYFDKAGEIRPGMAWMPMPKPPKEGGQE